MINFQEITTRLEEATCPEHNQHAQIKVLPEGVSIAACCQTWHDELNQRLEKEIEAAISRAFDATFGS
jgi:hypothetical protein